MAVLPGLARVGQAILDVLFPPRCAACGTYGAFLCGGCRQELPCVLPPRCPVCWQSQPQGALCHRCREERPAFEEARSPYLYQGPARELVHALKYNFLSALAPPMARLMADHLGEEGLEADLVAPVPLYGRRQRVRGYNQSALLAREISHLAGLPLAERALARRRDTPPQARSADAEARRRNVAEAFVAEPRRVKDRRVLVIDDVMTTGATLDACARALRQAGAASVCALTFARED
ncbi:MAG: ComF family protein [Chloroflexota bacterium]|nr:ComF family protein [Chloroflexota bacterium]